MRHCASCGRPIDEHVKRPEGRLCPIRPAKTDYGQPQRYVYDPEAGKAAKKART